VSQTEVLRCLINLGGNATINELCDAYNQMHFPRNTEYSLLSKIEVKKTMQGDTAKLLRDRMIIRIVSKPVKRNPYIVNRIIVSYRITEYGWKLAHAYKLLASQPLH
jgi:hypothetical protein